MDTPTYTGTITIGGASQTTQSKIGSFLPRDLITKQSGSLILTCVDVNADPFDLSSLTDTTVYAKPYGTNETPVSLGTGVVSGAGSNIFTITWVSDTMPAGWSSYLDDKDGAIVLYTIMDETGTADYFSWSTRFNVFDDTFTLDGNTLPSVNLVFYDNQVYEYDNTTTDADPGAGKFRLDNTTLASATEMYIADDNKSGVNLSSYWQSLGSGSDLYIANATTVADASYFTVSGTPTNNSGYTTIPITYVDAGTSSFTNGQYMSIISQKSGINNVVEDTTPQQGGNLDQNDFNRFNSGTGNIVDKLGDNAGSNKYSLTDSDDSEVFAVASNGNLTLSGTVDGRDIATDGAKLDNITVTQAVDLDTMESDISTNNAKVTNATHTGEVTGSGALTVDKTAITNKTLVTASGTDHVLVADSSDSDNLKKVLVSDFLGAGTDADAIHDNVAGEISAITAKGSPVGADHLLIEDSEDSDNKKNITIADLSLTNSQISDFDTGVSANSDVTANTAKVTNATHTGEVTGSGALTLDSTAITNKTEVTAASGDHVLISDVSDSGNLKKVLVSDLLGSGTDNDAIHDNVAGEISAITAKGSPVSGDFLLIEDSADSDNKKSITIGDLSITASQVSDFDTEVSNNASVTANTAKLTADETNVVSALDGATLTGVTVATGDKVLVQDADDSDNLKTVTTQAIADLAPVTSVNGSTGVVVLDPDDLDDTSTTNKFTTAGDISKLAGIESGADVTDEANVVSSLDGATLTSVTVATGDKVIVQDASDSDNIKTVTAQSIADLASGGSANWPPTTDNDKTTNFTITSGEENEVVVLTSGASADSTFTVDVSLLTALDSVILFVNESADILRVVVSNTGTMTLNTVHIDQYLSPGETMTISGDTSTNARIIARS